MITFSENQQKIIDRLKTERMSQTEFEQYAKEHGYIISTTNIIEQIRAEIADLDDAEYEFEGYYKAVNDAVQIIDKYR